MPTCQTFWGSNNTLRSGGSWPQGPPRSRPCAMGRCRTFWFSEKSVPSFSLSQSKQVEGMEDEYVVCSVSGIRKRYFPVTSRIILTLQQTRKVRAHLLEVKPEMVREKAETPYVTLLLCYICHYIPGFDVPLPATKHQTSSQQLRNAVILYADQKTKYK